jgi:acyl dehydratase
MTQVGSGGFGGARSHREERPSVPVPTRAPDQSTEQKTNDDQAVLYRQGSGDLNPLHIDASFAAVLGGPIG